MSLRKVFLSAALTLGLTAPALAQLYRPHEPLDPSKAQSLPLTPLSIQTAKGKVEFQVEVADDDRERSIGLMHRSELALNRGMLFDFKKPREVSFWMRNTFIPLDMLFIAKDGTIQAIAENTIPHNDKGVGPGPVMILGVLELQGGASAKLGIKPGDKVSHAIFAATP
jgi:uncharacterized membrane protein (UPF0127 family)